MLDDIIFSNFGTFYYKNNIKLEVERLDANKPASDTHRMKTEWEESDVMIQDGSSFLNLRGNARHFKLIWHNRGQDVRDYQPT